MFRRFEQLLDPYPAAPIAAPPARFFRFVWACTQDARLTIAALTLLTAMTGVFEAMLFSMLGRVVDWLAQVAPAQLWVQHRGNLLLLAGVLIASPLLIALQTIVKHQVLASNLPMRLRWNFHRLMLSQSIGFYQDEFAGRIAAKVMQTALAARDVVLVLCDVLTFIVIYFATMAAVVGGFDARLLLPFAGWLVLYVAALTYFVPRMGRVAQRQADARSLMTGRITDAYTNIATVKLFSHAQREAQFARSAMQDFMTTAYGQMRLMSGFEITNHVLSVTLILATTGATLWLWSLGELGVGAVAAATAMALRLNGISHWVMWEMASLFEHVGTVQDGMSTLSKLHTVVDVPNAKPLVVTRGDIRFENVSFGYGAIDPIGADPAEGAPADAEPASVVRSDEVRIHLRQVDPKQVDPVQIDVAHGRVPQPGASGTAARGSAALPASARPRQVIDHLSIHIRPGEKIGLVGRSGAGKSTLINLLLRLYDVPSGRLLIDGQDISQVTQESLRAQVGMVTQDTSLLHRSVRDNLLYGRPAADDAAMIAAARRAEAHDFIQHLTDAHGRRGYDAHVGERGVKLSGGQRQRIAIARVMLKDAPILLLDEATSALDSEVEAAIQASLYQLMRGKTVVAIAHRLSTIAAMDRLIVLDHGRIAEEGDHRSLLAAGGLYARLWAHQSGGFLGAEEKDERALEADRI